jgi:hypothetical protein
MTIIQASSVSRGRKSPRAASACVALLAVCIGIGCANAHAASIAPEQVRPSPASAQHGANAAQPEPAATEKGAPVYMDFADFWRHFREGLLKPDIPALARLTSFPVTTRGQSDSAPEGSIERALFSQLIRRLLAQDVGESEKQEPLLEYLKRNEKAPPSAVAGPSARVTHLQFALDPKSGWRFVGAFLAE